MQWFNKTAVVIGIIAALVYLRKFMKSGVFDDNTTRLDGKVVIVTGANTGIGKETALDLARRGAHVILACRNKQRGEKAAEDIRSVLSKNADVIFMKLDLASLQSVRQFAQEFKKNHKMLDILVNNAGIMMPPYTKTEDGFEVQFGVNHLGHFLLTNLLLDEIKAAAPSRIVNLSSFGHFFGTINFEDINSEKSYGRIASYGQSKLANILFSLELTDRLKGTGVTANSVHPGAVVTELQRHWSFMEYSLVQLVAKPFFWMFWKDPQQGAQTSIYCAVSPQLTHVSGKYFRDCSEATPSWEAQDKQVAKKLWNLSEKMVGLSQ